MKKEKKYSNKSISLAVSFAWELGYSIAIPLVLFALGGRFIDVKFDSSPVFFLLGKVLSIFVSSFIVFKKTLKIMRLLEEEGKRDIK